MKKTAFILALVMLLGVFASVMPVAAESPLFDEPIDSYDDYGYYIYYDFESYTGATSQLGYMRTTTTVNADGKLSDPFGFVDPKNGNYLGSCKLGAEGDNKFFSYTQKGIASASYDVVGPFWFQSGIAGDSKIIADAIEFSFKLRVKDANNADITDGARLALIDPRRGSKGSNKTCVAADKYGNIYAYINSATTLTKVYTNTDTTGGFTDISFRWYDASNCYSLYVNGKPVVEAMPLAYTFRDSGYVTVTENDDFGVDSRTLVGTADANARAIDFIRCYGTSFSFDVDDIMIKRIETAQRGAVYYENSFDASYADGVSTRSDKGGVYSFVNGSSATISRGEADENGNRYLNVTSGSSFNIKDTDYSLFSDKSYVIEASIKAKPTHSAEDGLKSLFAYTNSSSDGKTNVNWFGMIYVDSEGNLFIEDKETRLIGGYKLDGTRWLDFTVVAIKNNDNAGKFGKFSSTKSSLNSTYNMSYFINGEYVGSSQPIDLVEWAVSNSDVSPMVGRTLNNYDMTISHSEEELDTSSDNVTVVADGVNAATSTANHIIYKSKTAATTTYYDVTYNADGTQAGYSTMTLAAEKSGNNLLRILAGNAFEGSVDNVRVYEGTAPEWYHKNVNSEKGGVLVNANFGAMGVSGNDAEAQTSTGTAADISGVFRGSGFLFTRSVKKNADGVAITTENAGESDYATVSLTNNNVSTNGSGGWFDFFVPVPNEKNGKTEVEYSYETTIKNINITPGTNNNSGYLYLFLHRIEDEYDDNGTTKVKAFSSGFTMCVGVDGKLWGSTYAGKFALCYEDGTQIVLDNSNWNTLRADIHCVREGSNGYSTVSYYYNGELAYLEDGSLAYGIVNDTITGTLSNHLGTPNYRVRYTQLLNGDVVEFDVKSAKISANNIEKPVYGEVSGDAVDIDNAVTVFEMALPKYVNSNSAGFYDVVKLTSDIADSGLFSIQAKTGKVAVAANGKYYPLYTSDGDAVTLGDTPLPVAVVYNDILGKARYFVGGELAYISDGEQLKAAVELKCGPGAAASAKYTLFGGYAKDYSTDRVNGYNLNVYKITSSDAAEVIGFQESTINDGIRIIAGVDTLYYEKVGFEVEMYVNDVLQGSTDESDRIVYESIVANSQTVTAEAEGYNYLAALKIVELPESFEDNTYIKVRSYTMTGGEKHYDAYSKISVTNDGYEFVVTDDKDIYNKKQAVLLIGQSNMAGRGDVNSVEPISDERITMMRNLEWVPMSEPIHTDKEIAGVGLAASFAKAFVETFDCELGLIPAAVGGTSLSAWAVGGDLYNTALERAKAAQKDSEICAILWHQGCSDTTNSNYAAKFKVILDGFIEDLGLDPEKIVIIAGELGEFRPDGGANVNNAIASLVGTYKNYSVASSEGLLALDVTTHFDGPSLRVFGYRYFNEFYRMVTGKTYEFDDDPESYRITIEPDETVDDTKYVANATFNELTAGTSYTESATLGVCKFVPAGCSIDVLVNPADSSDKYVGINWSKPGNQPYIDVTTVHEKGSVVVTEAKFMINDGFQGGGAPFKLGRNSPSVSTIHPIKVDKNGILYNAGPDNKQGDALINPKTGNAYVLDKFEWTTIKVVADFAKNTKDIYIDGVLCLEGAQLTSSVSASSSFELAFTRIMQFDPYTGSETRSGIMYVDDFKSYRETIFNSSFNGCDTMDSITSSGDFGGVYLSCSSNVPCAVVEDGSVSGNKYITITSKSTGVNAGYIDVPTVSEAGRDFVVEARVKIAKQGTNSYAACGDLLKILNADQKSIALIRLDADGTLRNFSYPTNTTPQVGDSFGVKLSETEWTDIKVVCHMSSNTKDVYINGELVGEGLELYLASYDIASYAPFETRIVQFKNSGKGTVCFDSFTFYN